MNRIDTLNFGGMNSDITGGFHVLIFFFNNLLNFLVFNWLFYKALHAKMVIYTLFYNQIANFIKENKSWNTMFNSKPVIIAYYLYIKA